MFRGISELSLDSKGRFAIPTKHRAPLFDSNVDLQVDTAKEGQSVKDDTLGDATCATNIKETAVTAQGQSPCVVTIDPQSTCLLIFPMTHWEIIEAQVVALPSFDPQARRVQRLLLGHATELAPDSHGRLVLPQPLREFAKLEKELVLVGQGKKLELWDKARWSSEREEWIQAVATTATQPAGLMSVSL